MKYHKLNQEYTSQELNGITDWFQDAVDYTSDVVSDAALWVTEKTGTTSTALALTEALDQKASELTTSMKAKFKEFQVGYEKLIALQKKVDEGIESMPYGADKTRLEAKRSESRGIFSNYILPGWEALSSWAGFDDNANYNDTGLGLVFTLTAAAALTAVTLGLTYLYSAHQLELKILNDPALAKTYVATRGSLFSLGGSGKYIALGLGGLGLIYFLSSTGILSKRSS